MSPTPPTRERDPELETVFRMVADHSIDGVVIGRPDGDILYANPAACEMLRATQEQLRRIGRGGLTDERDPAWQAMGEERRRTGKVRGVARMFRADGTSFLADIASSVFTSPDGKQQTCVMLRDVTEQVFQDRNLAAYNEVAEALLAATPIRAVLQIVARHARIVFEATDALVLTPAEPPDDVMVIAGDGPFACQMLGRAYPGGSLARQVMESRQPLLVEDMLTRAPFEDGRRFGAGGAIVAPIVADDHVYGVLFVGVTSDKRPYHAEELELVTAYARRTALVIALGEAREAAERQQRRLNDQLQKALRSRIIIEQAKGVISATRRITPEEGFQRLRAYARSHNQDVHTVARAVVERRLMI